MSVKIDVSGGEQIKNAEELRQHVAETYPNAKVKVTQKINWTEVNPETKVESIRVQDQKIEIEGLPEGVRSSEVKSLIAAFTPKDVEVEKLEAILRRSPLFMQVLEALK